MKVYARTDIGKIRPLNEDNYYIPIGNEPFCAVADGMGGHNAGEIAASIAVATFGETMRMMGIYSALALQTAVTRANGLIYDESLRDGAKQGMGTTFTALAKDGENIRIAHVGDSRAYLIRNNALVRVTTDHTLVEEMVVQGLITPSEARVHPKRNYVTRALGIGERVEVDTVSLEYIKGDVYLLCTDGLSNHVSESNILRIIQSALSWNEKVDCLIAGALQDGGPDNITAMIVTFEEENS